VTSSSDAFVGDGFLVVPGAVAPDVVRAILRGLL